MTPFSSLLRTLRERAGLSQVALAARAGCNHSTVSRYEYGDRLPTPAMTGRLADALGLSERERAALLRRVGTREAVAS